jgi:hypothetical protein
MGEHHRGCLERAVSQLSDDGAERRHDVLMRLATDDLGLERDTAEQIYALSLEEKLEPVYAFELVRCGVGVRDLEPVEQDEDDAAAQQSPPAWVEERGVELEDADIERRLRLSFRRFRTLLETSVDAVAAAQAFVAAPDIGPLRVE